MRRQYFVYIMTNRAYGTLYVGMTNDLIGRAFEHRSKEVRGFTQEHGLGRLVWYEIHEDPYEAITREKRIKNWNRDWKVNLIQRLNPGWTTCMSSSSRPVKGRRCAESRPPSPECMRSPLAAGGTGVPEREYWARRPASFSNSGTGRNP